MQLPRLFHGHRRSLVHMLLCMLWKRCGKASVRELWWFLWHVSGSLASVASAGAAANLALPRCCFQGSSMSSGPCFFCWEQHCVKLFCSDAVTHGNIPSDTSRAGETLIMCCCTRNSRLLQLCWVLLVIGLVLPASWKQKGGRFRKQEKKCFYFLKPKLPCEISHPEHSLGGLQSLQQDCWLRMCLRLYASAVLGNSISRKPQCLNLYFSASVPLRAAAHPPPSSPSRYRPFCSHSKQATLPKLAPLALPGISLCGIRLGISWGCIPWDE